MFKSRTLARDDSFSLTTDPSALLVARIHALLPGLKAGRPAAYYELHSLMADRLFRSAFRMLNNRQDAEDAVQEAFLELIRSGCPPDEGRSLQSWLFTSVRFNCVDQIRRRRRRPSTPEADVPDRIVLDDYWLGADPELEAAMAKLTDLQRSVIHMKYVEGLDGHSIAEALGTNRAAVYAAAARAERSLGRELTHPKGRPAGCRDGRIR